MNPADSRSNSSSGCVDAYHVVLMGEEGRSTDFDPKIELNVKTFEDRARALEMQEIDRARSIDQKTAALMAACLVVLGASVAFASRIGELDGGSGARVLWAALLIAAMSLVAIGLGFATWAVRPQAIVTGIHIDELEQWSYEEKLLSDPVVVRGELMRASVDAVGEARVANKKKGDRLSIAFGCFAAGLAATLVLGIAVAVRQVDSSMNDKSQAEVAKKAVPVKGPSDPKPEPLFRTLKRDHTLRESDYQGGHKP